MHFLFVSIVTNRLSQVFRYETVRWYYTFFGFTSYPALGAFMMQVFDMSDAYHIAEPLISDTPLTARVMAPMYAVGYSILLLIAEMIKKRNKVREVC